MKGEAIVYDGQMYYGPVPIKVEDYYEDTIYMIFYDSESMAREQEVRISGIESAEMYIDKNENGKVDAGDTMVGYLNDDRYVNSFFDREDGKQKLLKFDYVMLPRKINTTPADDTSIRYDVKASFVTTATSDAELARYTNEMKTYREIETGDTKVPIYGVEAMNGSITVPLGGDKTPPIYDETEKKWSWTPDFEGNLKTPFTNPAKIEEAERETVAGPKEISGTDEINDYIGSFRNSDQVVLQLYNNYEEMVDRYDSVSTYREIVLGEFEQDQDLKFGVPEGGDNQDTPGAEKPEMELPQIDIPAGPFKVILDGNRAGFELGIPLFGGGNQEASDKDTGVFGKNASKYLDDMKDAVGKGAPDKNIFDQLKNAAKGLDDTGKALKPKADVDVSFMFGFSASFMWEYDEIEAQWEFDEAKIFVTFNGEVKISQRLPPLPIVYVYIIFSADVEVGLNIEVDYGFEEGLRTSQVTCTGDISLEIEVEAGVGIGVDLCKFEIFLKINTGLSPEYLELEITESVAVKNYDYITDILDKLKKMGVRIALDDFGTGYSSLNYLKNFAITTLKIDRSFIHDINENPKNSAIVSSILAMGRNLKLCITAEGIETREQYETLRNKGCDIIQGFYFNEPLPLNEFEKVLK
jgi:hypothetical protein